MMTSQVVRRLEARGLVERVRDPGDSRSRRIALTARGGDALAAALADVEAVDAGFFAPLAAETARFTAGLAALAGTPPA